MGRWENIRRSTFRLLHYDRDTMNRIAYLQHVPFEGLGSIDGWARHHGHTAAATRLFEAHAFPALADFDWVIIMGGPMGVHDDETHSWLGNEKRFINQAIRAGKVVIGICLGAQLIADVLGARVFRNAYREIGWFPMRLQGKEGIDVFRDLPNTIEAFHWHGDTFDMPSGAVEIGSSEACRNQGFVYSENVYAFQFHLEVTLEGAHGLIRNCSEEMVDGKYIQTGEEIIRDPRRFESANEHMTAILRRIDERSS
ncbi:Glutamine amidotransferase, class I [Olavius algarvensis associated proteobacterium Delta 3]|nr:Glutamine amidotransferase, class I [Olavius algarvensis associated proteobacterium Delta 3]CAB5163635.1 Glutamine amidotransferase, class I [Olavius algarvensis associated proteobacterium Delta 3]